MPVQSLSRFAVLLSIATLVAAGWAPRAVAQEAVTESTAAESDQTVTTLEAIMTSVRTKRAALEAKRREIDAEPSPERKLELLLEEEQIEAELEALETDFESVATRIDVEAFESGIEQDFNLRAELEGLLKPIIEELKDATESPRQIEQLRADLAFYRDREEKVGTAIGRLEQLIEDFKSGDVPDGTAERAEVLAELERTLGAWRDERLAIENKAAVAQHQLDSRLQDRQPLIESTRSVLSTFFATRGMNLILAIVTFIVVFSVLRILYRFFIKIRPVRRGIERSFASRLVEVIFHLFVGMAALIASLLVLYAAGDWVLLGLVLLFLLGVVWASQRTLPRFFEQIRVLLNLGTVRERERVVYNGLPWLVQRLSIYTKLTNPELTGGVIRLPIAELVDLHSRPCGEREAWFPCRENDWVRLADGRRGKVVCQTPEMVQMRLIGGSMVSYQTRNFLDLHPENLSVDFRITVTFGIDYRHQPMSTTEIPDVMKQRLQSELVALVGQDDVVNVQVEFKAAGASSLDYLVLADFKGNVAERLDALHRAIQRILVDTCNEQGWVIPFTQITVHGGELVTSG